MLAVWAYIEADFLRDYGIRLVDELPHMSWREFTVLLGGLNPFGALATHYDSALKQQREEETRTERGAKENADNFWRSFARI